MLRLGDTVSRAMLLDPMNLIRSVLFVLLMACTAVAQFTLPAGVLPAFDAPTSQLALAAKSDPKVIVCGSVQFEPVTFTDRAVLFIPGMSWPPLDWDNMTNEQQEELLDSLAHTALLLAFANPSSFLLEYWKNLASAIGMRDYTCDPCPREHSTQCLMSANSTIVMPIPPEDIDVVGEAGIGGGLLLTVDFTVTFDVWITCDTKEGCR